MSSRYHIHVARDIHLVRDQAEYRREHELAIGKLAARGAAIAVQEDTRSLIAYVNHGRWIVDCPCGAGSATDPAWREARCFGCGTVYANVVFPPDEDRARIEALLMKRPRIEHRNWFPHERVDDLAAENVAHGVAG